MTNLRSLTLSSIIGFAAALTGPLLVGCAATSGGDGVGDDLGEEVVAGDDSADGRSAESVTSPQPVGTTLRATSNVNLRNGPSTSKSVLRVIPTGATVTVVESNPQSGFYKVNHAGMIGWSFGSYYDRVSSGSGSGTGTGSGDTVPSGTSGPDSAISRAKSGVGYSYWWGHGRWSTSPSANVGSCSGSCPSCTHSGSYGADCSGYVAKAWSVPASNDDITNDSHPYSTSSFVGSSSQWSTVSRSNLRRADALVYNDGGRGHIFLYESGDGWGSVWAYEAKGCASGIVKNLRSVSSAYKGIRRAGY